MSDTGRLCRAGVVHTVEAGDRDWPVLAPMVELEREEMAVYGTISRDADGRPVLSRADRYRDQLDTAHQAWLVLVDSEAVGFALTRPVEGRRFIDALWIGTQVRGRGAGGAAAHALLLARPGAWAVAFLEENTTAAAMWRRVIGEVGAEAVESSRVNSGTTFTWIDFEVSGGQAAAG